MRSPRAVETRCIPQAKIFMQPKVGIVVCDPIELSILKERWIGHRDVLCDQAQFARLSVGVQDVHHLPALGRHLRKANDLLARWIGEGVRKVRADVQVQPFDPVPPAM